MRIPDIDTGLPVTFSNSNGVSFGTNGDVITASIATSLTNINISAGTTSNNLSAVTFANGNNVSFGLNASTITASIATSLTNINISAGTTSNNLSAVTFSNSNGISFGLNGSTVTASVATSLTNINVSAGTTSNNLSAITFSNSNNVSFGLNGSTITATVTVASSLTNINVSAGSTSNLLSAITFSNANGVSFGLNASTITASIANATPTMSIWENMSDPMMQASTFNTFSVVPLNPEVMPGNITANTFMIGVNGNGSQSTSSGSMLFSFGIYTFNASTLSLLNSVATSLTYAAVANNSTAYSGFRWLTIHSSQWSAQPTFSRTHYWLGYIVSSSNATQSLNLHGAAFLNAQGRFGTIGVNTNASAGSYGWTPFFGAYSATTSQLPGSVNQSDLNAAATSVGNFIPHVVLNNLMASF